LNFWGNKGTQKVSNRKLFEICCDRQMVVFFWRLSIIQMILSLVEQFGKLFPALHRQTGNGEIYTAVEIRHLSIKAR
jgi:hypothetical protein